MLCDKFGRNYSSSREDKKNGKSLQNDNANDNSERQRTNFDQ